MLERRQDPSDKPGYVDPKERLYNFGLGLFERLDKEDVSETTDLVGGVHARKTFISLDDGSEVGLTYETVLPDTTDETDLMVLVHRKKNREGKFDDFLYGINVTAIEDRLIGNEVPAHALQLIINTAAEGEVTFTPLEAKKANIEPHHVVMSGRDHAEKHNAASEVIMNDVLSQVMRQPEANWHNNWTVEKTA